MLTRCRLGDTPCSRRISSSMWPCRRRYISILSKNNMTQLLKLSPKFRSFRVELKNVRSMLFQAFLKLRQRIRFASLFCFEQFIIFNKLMRNEPTEFVFVGGFSEALLPGLAECRFVPDLLGPMVGLSQCSSQSSRLFAGILSGPPLPFLVFFL